MSAKREAARVEAVSASQLRAWLEENHGQEDSVWLVTYKKSAGSRYVSTEEILDELVAFGWTDGIRQKVDDERTMQLISPRRTKTWAKSYMDRAERLIIEGRMHPAGQAMIDIARQSGTWDGMNEVDALILPQDLADALIAHGNALGNFTVFPPSTRRNTLRWVATARTAPTRQRRIDQIAADAERDIRTPVNGARRLP